MEILDPGHIYRLTHPLDGSPVDLIFVKRGGGAIQYPKEWPGIQTQAVMRAIIDHLKILAVDPHRKREYALWQLGTDETKNLLIGDKAHISQLIDVLVDRSKYLNGVLECIETGDAISWLAEVRYALFNKEMDEFDRHHHAIGYMEMALWNYEARAYRRKREKVNREKPAHDDSMDPKPWRTLRYADVPFNEIGIAYRPIGPDGHIVI